MRTHEDIVEAIDEPNDVRMNFRTKARIKQAIQRAAALSGVDDTAFAINAAYRSALATISAHERSLLLPVDHQTFFEALDNPPTPSKSLVEAYERHKATVTSR